MLSKLAKFVDKNTDYKLLITSSMGQEAVECEPTETQLCVKNSSKFFEMLSGKENLNSCETSPSMIPQFNFTVKNDFEKVIRNNLSELSINGKKIVFRENNSNFFSVDFGHNNLKDVVIHLNGIQYPMEEFGLENMEIEDKSSSTAYHIPEGHLFSYHPENKETDYHNEELPTCDILPVLLNNFNIKTKSYMNKTTYKNL